MTPYTPQDAFSAQINIMDITDPVLGGTGGEANNPIKALADRTEYLKNRLGRFLGVKTLAANGSVVVDDLFNLIKVNASDNLTVTLASVALFPVGGIIPFKIKCVPNKSVTIQPAGLEIIEDGFKSWEPLWACDGDEFKLIAVDADNNGTADIWVMVDAKGNFDIAGNDGLFRIQPRNSAVANGAEVLRADFPRAWSALSGTAIPDLTWNSNIRFKQFASTGNGTTTFRWPDTRSMMYKGLDLGRGLSLGRLDNIEGGLELDAIKEHYHKTTLNPNANSQTGSGKVTVGGDGSEGVPPEYKSAGAIDASNVSIGNNETLVKNIGLIPVIFY